MNKLKTIEEKAITPALALLPAAMDTTEARVMLFAIGLQESRFEHTYQILSGRPGVKGPARGYWQFERGSRLLGGGVWGVFKHKASRYWLHQLCMARDVAFEPAVIWERLEYDSVLAAGVARLLLFTDPKRLPALGEVEEAWVLYARRTWRPGKPHYHTWHKFYEAALAQAAPWFKR